MLVSTGSLRLVMKTARSAMTRINLNVICISFLLTILGCRNESRNDSADPSPSPTTQATDSGETDHASDEVAVATTELAAAPGLGSKSLFVPLADVVSNVDPREDDGWETEAFNEAVSTQLHHLGDMLKTDKADRGTVPIDFVSPQFQCDPLVPPRETRFVDAALRVERSAKSTSPNESPVETHRGLAGFRLAIENLLSVFGGTPTSNVRTKFKVIRVELDEQSGKTESYFELSGRTPDGIVQVNATWDCRWSIDAQKKEPKLEQIRVRDYEQILPTRKQAGLFVDCTEAVLGSTSAYQKQLAYGADHWYGNLDVAFGIRQGNQGLAFGDINGDGLDDMYVCQPAGLPNRLFVHQGDGTLIETTREAGVDWLDLSHSALMIDLDNDGDQDLVVVLKWSLVVHENDGQGKFRLAATIETKFNLMSLSAADYDNDGRLDLYVCGYSPGPEGSPTDIFANPVPYHDANNGARNFLLRNDGEFSFTDVTESVGLDVNNRRFSFAAAWEDFDNDGDLDIYVANDFGRNNLYRNDGGEFTDIAAEAGVEDIAAGMSVSWSDYDHDGMMDLYVSNMFSSAGNRIAFQNQFKPDADDDTLRQLQRHARGNSLFRNVGNGRFEDVSVEAGVTMGRWAWGSVFTDLNNDGWDDIYVTNGFYTSEDSGDL